MTRFDLMRSYSTDEKCRALLEKLRWPGGPECPRCKGRTITRINGKTLLCSPCQYQFSVTAGTIFNDSHLPLEKWFVSVLLICEARKGISANELKRTVGISYKTAWYLCHRIRAAMGAAGAPRPGRDGKRRRRAKKEIVRGIADTWHAPSAKHLPAYIGEIEFRSNRRKRSDLFVDTLRLMVTANPLTFENLTK